MTVNSIASGYVKTDLSSKLDEERLKMIVNRTPMKRLSSTSDVIPIVLFLLSEDASFISGQTILVDGDLYSETIILR